MTPTAMPFAAFLSLLFLAWATGRDSNLVASSWSVRHRLYSSSLQDSLTRFSSHGEDTPISWVVTAKARNTTGSRIRDILPEVIVSVSCRSESSNKS